jgi:hypothetical protein
LLDNGLPIKYIIFKNTKSVFSPYKIRCFNGTRVSVLTD